MTPKPPGKSARLYIKPGSGGMAIRCSTCMPLEMKIAGTQSTAPILRRTHPVTVRVPCAQYSERLWIIHGVASTKIIAIENLFCDRIGRSIAPRRILINGPSVLMCYVDSGDASGANIRAPPDAGRRFKGCPYFESCEFQIFSLGNHELEPSCIVQPHTFPLLPATPGGALMPFAMG